MAGDIGALCGAMEECYEFMLSYAGQGLAGDQGAQIRDHLERASRALSELPECYSQILAQDNLEPAEPYRAFGSVLAADARNALAAVELVLAQKSISSQLIDNLNASIHLRSLLTDLFLIDEILKTRHSASSHRQPPATV